MTKPVGELTLTLCGCISLMRGSKNNKDWEGYFNQKTRFNQELKPEYLAIDWNKIHIFLDVKQAYIIKGERAIEEGNKL